MRGVCTNKTYLRLLTVRKQHCAQLVLILGGKGSKNDPDWVKKAAKSFSEIMFVLEITAILKISRFLRSKRQNMYGNFADPKYHRFKNHSYS